MVTATAPFKQLEGENDIRSVVEVRSEFREHEQRIIELIAQSGCLLHGHFALLSGQHSDFFLRFRSFARTRASVDFVARLLVEQLSGLKFESVLAPATAGSILAHAINDELEIPHGPVIVPTDEGGHPVDTLEPGLVRAGERVLVVNDLVTAGKGLRKLIELVSKAGATVAGIALFANRHVGGPLAAIDGRELPEAHVIDLEVDHLGLEGGPTGPQNCWLCAKSTADLIESRALN